MDPGSVPPRRWRAKLLNCSPLLALGLMLFSVSGCQSSRMALKSPVPEKPSSFTQYSDLVLNYETTSFNSILSRLSPAKMGESLSEKIQQVSAEQPAELPQSGPVGQWSQARIQIIYPHPDGSVDKGLARLVVSRHVPGEAAPSTRQGSMKTSLKKLMLKASGTSSEMSGLIEPTKTQSRQIDEEVWQLDLAKEELDILISELSHRGFFDQQERPRGDALVSVKVDEGALSKRWTSEPRLEGLMLQIYNEGELAAFNTRNSRMSPASMSSEQTKAGLGS